MAMSSPSVPQRLLHLFWRVCLIFVATTLIYSGLFALANSLYGPTYTTSQLWVCVGFPLVFQTVLQFVSFQGPLLVSISPMLEAVALGSIPFALGIMLIDLWFTNRTHWRVSEEDISPTLPT